VKILIIGGGSIGRRHIKNLHRLGYGDIACLKRKQDENFAGEHSVKVLTDFSEASANNPDVIFICTPTSLHLEGLKYATANSMHIFMEKPLVDTSGRLEESIKLLIDYKRVFFIGFMLRYHPMVIRIKSILDEGLLGQVFNARFEFGSYLPFWHPYEDYKISYAARSDLGGGVINTITHELDLIQYFFGEPKQVTCRSANFNLLEIDVEEQSEAIFEYPDKQVTLHLDYLQKDYNRFIKILGRDGRLEWNWHNNYIELQLHQQKLMKIETPENFDVNQLYLNELEDFFSLIKGNTTTHPLDQDHAIKNTKLMLAMHQSDKSKSLVTMEP
jgi:predicted dehydrogenase